MTIDPISVAALAVALCALWLVTVHIAAFKASASVPETIVRHEVVQVPFYAPRPPVEPVDASEGEILRGLEEEQRRQEMLMEFPEIAESLEMLRNGTETAPPRYE